MVEETWRPDALPRRNIKGVARGSEVKGGSKGGQKGHQRGHGGFKGTGKVKTGAGEMRVERGRGEEDGLGEG